MSKKILSKTQLMRGFQCHKNLWLKINRPELESETDAATQAQFEEGNEVGELARTYAGKGVLIDEEYWNYEAAHEATQAAIKKGEKLIFEASFLVDGLFARADILKKDKAGWHLIEVKKSTKVKDYHYQDSGIQKHIIESAGIKIQSVSIMFINSKTVFPDLTKLFSTEDVTNTIAMNEKAIVKEIESLKKIAASKNEPKKKIGAHCSDPFDCPFKAHCWQSVPKYSVLELPTVDWADRWDLFESGKEKIKDLDAKKFKGLAQRAIEVVKSGKPYIDSQTIKDELKKWNWPLYFFDYETLGSAIPRFDGTKPYDKVPFQFSCHVWKSEDSKKLDHFEYLQQEAGDPRPALIKAMLEGFGPKGSIVAYSKSFEIGVIKKLAEFDKKNSKELLALIPRFVDPWPLIKDTVYHPDFEGLFSIKNVAPALIGDKLNYENLDVGDGKTAQAWAEKILKGQLTGPEKKKAISNLLEYCRQDTMAMVDLVKWLLKQ